MGNQTVYGPYYLLRKLSHYYLLLTKM